MRGKSCGQRRLAGTVQGVTKNWAHLRNRAGAHTRKSSLDSLVAPGPPTPSHFRFNHPHRPIHLQVLPPHQPIRSFACSWLPVTEAPPVSMPRPGQGSSSDIPISAPHGARSSALLLNVRSVPSPCVPFRPQMGNWGSEKPGGVLPRCLGDSCYLGFPSKRPFLRAVLSDSTTRPTHRVLVALIMGH